MSGNPKRPIRMLLNPAALTRAAPARIRALGKAGRTTAPGQAPQAPSPAPSVAPAPAPGGQITITTGPTSPAHLDVQALVREAEELRRQATLADARAGFERLYAEHRGYLERLAALAGTAVCPADELVATLDALGQQWFAPEVSDAVYTQIDQLSSGLVAEAGAIADQVGADPAALADPTKPTAVIMRERIKGLGRRIEDAEKEIGGMFADLVAALGEARKRIEGMERTAKAIEASGLGQGQLSLACVSYSRKVRLEGRGTGYVTLAGPHLIFQPVQTSGILLWKSDQVGSPEVIDISGGVTLTDLHRPILGDHGVTLRQDGTEAHSFRLSLGREALDDLVSAAS